MANERSQPPRRQPSKQAPSAAYQTVEKDAGERAPLRQDLPPLAGAGAQAPVPFVLPEPVTRRGISEEQWRTLKNNLYPGALNDSCLMVWDYCKARKLDPMKKPCHIVPMEVEVKELRPDGSINKYKVWRDVVMPGIYEYRTTAMRTGLYLGHKTPEYGDWFEYKGVRAPEYCTFVVLRWNEKAQRVTEFPVTIFFDEIVALKNNGEINARWRRSPHQMLTKCAEAAALREAFPDELGGEHTSEEMEGRAIEDFDDSVVSTTGNQLNVASAGAALRARVVQPAQSAQPRVEGEPAAHAPPVEEESQDIPWDIESDSKLTQSEWLELINAVAQDDVVAAHALFARIADVYEQLQKEIPLPLEAAIDIKLGK